MPDVDPDLAPLRRCVGDVDAFAARHWGRSPLLRRGAGPFDDLLDLETIDELLTSTARRPTFRLVRDGATLPEAEVTTKVRLGGRTLEDAADVLAIGAAVADGATLVLQGLQRTWLPLARFCRSLERATSHPVQANAYLTPPGAAGLRRHADDHDVLVLQLDGAKSWDVEGLGPLELREGDVLYLPAGTHHSASAQERPSLHLTVGVLRDTYRGVLARVLARVDDLDAPLPLGYAREGGGKALRDGLQAMVDAVTDHLGKVDLDTLTDSESERAVRRRRPLLDGHLAAVLAPIDDATRVTVRADAPVDAWEHDDGIDLVLADRTVRLPVQAVAAVRALLDGEASVADLPGLDAPGRAVLVRRLIREGLLRSSS